MGACCGRRQNFWRARSTWFKQLKLNSLDRNFTNCRFWSDSGFGLALHTDKKAVKCLINWVSGKATVFMLLTDHLLADEDFIDKDSNSMEHHHDHTTEQSIEGA